MNALISIIAILILAISPASQSTRLSLPSELGPFKLVESIEGEGAQSFVNRLHAKEVAPQHSMMGKYLSGNHRATLYVSVYDTDASATEASKRMTEHIKAGNQVFRHYVEVWKRVIKIGRCMGLGQVHFFFQFRNKVFWLAVDPSVASDAIDSLSRFVLSTICQGRGRPQPLPGPPSSH
jgi:hypothetical protein